MSLSLDASLDLGRDTERMKPEDKRRQEATVSALLKAFTQPLPDRREVQLLADEVGLGKTFVALAAGYSLLKAVRTQSEVAEACGLGKCSRAIVVVVPSSTLAGKWHREVEALRTRCSMNRRETDWFHSRICENAYDLVESLRRASDLRRNPRENPCVLICSANIFSKRLPDLGDRLRFLAACLFRWWGSKLNHHERYRVVSRAVEVPGFSDWAESARRIGPGQYEVNLWDFDSGVVNDHIPFAYSEIASALDTIYATDSGRRRLDEESAMTRDGCEEPAGLLPYCKDIAQRRGNAEWYFQGFKSRLLGLYKELAHHLIRQDLPLVIVDEAHHWRNAYRQDCQSFRKHLAPHTRRLLMLTATPFQLHRDELLEVLSVADEMEPAIGDDRVAQLRTLRQKIETASADSEEAGVEFSREWGQLPDHFARIDAKFEAGQGFVPGMVDPRTDELARHWSTILTTESSDGQAPLSAVPGDLRRFFKAALALRTANDRLRTAMRSLIIRHKRAIGHRRVLVGREYPNADSGSTRPDQHLLHLAPGATLGSNTKLELAQYLLMKIVAESTRGTRRTALGSDLTGCYTTLWESQTGAKAQKAAQEGGNPRLFQILRRLTGHRDGQPNREDAHHPKVHIVVEEVLRRWEQGEKTLIFCFRVPTARILQTLLADGVEHRLKRARRSLMEMRGTPPQDDAGMKKAIQDFRRTLTAKEGTGVPLFIDRVLLGWFQRAGIPLPSFTDEDRIHVAQLYARANLFRGGERIRLDRVFLNRAIEHVWGNSSRQLRTRASPVDPAEPKSA